MVGLLPSGGKAVECNLRPLAPDTDQCCEWASFWKVDFFFFSFEVVFDRVGRFKGTLFVVEFSC